MAVEGEEVSRYHNREEDFRIAKFGALSPAFCK